MLNLSLPDVTSTASVDSPATLQWVGMEGIATPLKIRQQIGDVLSVPAMANVLVSLDEPQAKGIHMSRLQLILNQLA